jgi:hypothetical protein
MDSLEQDQIDEQQRLDDEDSVRRFHPDLCRECGEPFSDGIPCTCESRD